MIQQNKEENQKLHPKHNGFFQKKTRPLILGHRGVPKAHQENTVAGFRRALEIGVEGIEFDVFKTRDNKIVVFHDETTERLTGFKGNIEEMTWDEISKLRISRQIDMGDGQIVTYASEEKIPLLEEVLDEFKGKLLMNIELKSYSLKWSKRKSGKEAARVIRHTGAEDSVIVTSFDLFKLHTLEQEYPGLHSGFAYDDGMIGKIGVWFTMLPEIRSELAKAPGNQNDTTFLNFICESNVIGKLLGSTVVDAEYTLIDSDTIAKFHQKEMLMGSYTFFPLDTRYVKNGNSDEEQIQILHRLVNLEVDWIETDDPEKAKQVLDKI